MGRKPLMLWGLFSIGLGMMLLGIGFAIGLGESVSLFVIAACVITMGYSLYAPICWILQSEMFPTNIRGRSMAISVLFSNVCQFIVNFAFLPMVDVVGDTGVFFLFFTLSVLGVLYVFLFCIETKEMDPQMIIERLKQHTPYLLLQQLYEKIKK